MGGHIGPGEGGEGVMFLMTRLLCVCVWGGGGGGGGEGGSSGLLV